MACFMKAQKSQNSPSLQRIYYDSLFGK